MRIRLFAIAIIISFACVQLGAQRPSQDQSSQNQAATSQAQGGGSQRPTPPSSAAASHDAAEPEPVVTHHQVTVRGRTLRYSATAGRLPFRNAESGEIEAYIFFIAYSLEGAKDRNRPLTFAFNGGPGSSSVWLHLGDIGPKRVKMLPEGGLPAPPYTLEDNQYTWLEQSDLVFIDPVGTGYSRSTKKEFNKKFWGLRGDIASVGEFIRFYLTRYERWGAPLFLAGESYGTTRASGLSGYLIDRGIPFNGIILISSVLNFQTLSFAPGNDIAYVLYLPSFTATAWYHKKLSGDLQADLHQAVAAAEQYVPQYENILSKGDRITPQERQAAIDQLARLTGLDKQVIDGADLHISQPLFCRELLRSQHKVVGRLDSRFTGAELGGGGGFGYDPSEAAIRPPYTVLFNEYVRTELGYKSDLEYYILGGGINEPWDMGTGGNGYANVSEELHRAFVKDPYLHLFVGKGYYDLATAFYAADYTIAHLGLDPSVRANVTTGEYEAGHMMYIRDSDLERLHSDIAKFMQNALKTPPPRELGR
jgi:carboxypeptidase C (cathepsin A)